MIKLTRLDGSELFLNPDLIELIEETPDTHITLTNGNKYLFLEPAQVIIERTIAFKARVMKRAAAGADKKYLQRRRSETYRPFCQL